jgi:tRNA threonylcarbamoyladenosine biosynthesis protein TsaB
LLLIFKGKKPMAYEKNLTNNPDISSKKLILALETSGRTGSVALGTAIQLLAETNFTGVMRHNAELFPIIDNLLRKAYNTPQNIGEIFISVGPGSFTGLRIAVAFAKMLNLATGASIVAIDTLDVIAANAIDYIGEKNTPLNKIAVILDAKRGQFFTAAYQNTKGTWEKTTQDCLMSPDKFLAKFAGQTPIWLLGEGLVYYKDKFKADGISFFDEDLWAPKASQVYKLGLVKAAAGQFEDPLALQPLYLRRALEI